MKKKVGIFGGTFDPIHFGHLNLAISLMEECHLDEVLFVPASVSPFKENAKPLASAVHRLEMLKLAIAPLPKFQIYDGELQQSGPSYTIDTVRKLSQDKTRELHLLMGEDHLASFHRWKEADTLVKLAPPLVAAREVSKNPQAQCIKTPLFEISSTALRKRLAQKRVLRPSHSRLCAGLYSETSLILTAMSKTEPSFYLNAIAQAIFDKKGMNILALDVRKISSLTDYVIIAEGNIDKHVSAIAYHVIEQMEKLGQTTVYVEGMKTGDWIVIDYLHIMVHLFMPGLRDKYQLEQLWREGEIVDLHIDIGKEDPAFSQHHRK